MRQQQGGGEQVGSGMGQVQRQPLTTNLLPRPDLATGTRMELHQQFISTGSSRPFCTVEAYSWVSE